MVALFRWDILQDIPNSGFSIAYLRLQIEAKNLFLNEIWDGNPIFCAFISIVTYYMIFN